MSPSRFSLSPVATTTRSAGSVAPGPETDAFGREAIDRVGHDRRAAGADRSKQVAVGDQADALVPRVVARREVGARVAGRPDLLGRHRDDALLDLGRPAPREPVVIRADQHVLPARERVREVLGQEALQEPGDRVARRAGDDIGRRALQHGHVRRRLGERGDERYRRRAAADDDDLAAADIEPFGPELRVDEPAGEVALALEGGPVALVVAVVAAADEQESRAPAHRRAVGAALAVHRPARGRARPLGTPYDVAEADLRDDACLVGGRADVAQDRRAVGDRLRVGPWPEAVAERVHVGVGADARVAEQVPGAADRPARLDDQVALAGAPFLQVMGRADARKARPDNQHVEQVVSTIWMRREGCGRVRHGSRTQAGPAQRETVCVISAGRACPGAPRGCRPRRPSAA